MNSVSQMFHFSDEKTEPQKGEVTDLPAQGHSGG